jgi:hypothetical protein
MGTRQLLRQIERAALVLGALAIAASAISLDRALIGGVFTGAAVGYLNLAMVRLLFERGSQSPEQRGTVLVAFMVKSVLLLLLVAVVVFGFRVDAIGFIAGFSSAVLAIMVVPVIRFVGGARPSAETGGEGEE